MAVDGGAGTGTAAQRAEWRERLVQADWLVEELRPAAARLVDICSWRKVEPGQTLYRLDDESADLLGIVEGQVAIKEHVSGNLDVDLVHAIWPGEWVGYAPIVSGQKRRVRVECRTRTIFAVAPERELRAFLASDPTHWHLMALIVDATAAKTSAAALDLLRRQPHQRLAATLLRLVNCRWHDASCGPPWDLLATQQEIAEGANMSRNAVSRMLKQMETQGLVRLHYGHLEVLDAARLRHLLSA